MFLQNEYIIILNYKGLNNARFKGENYFLSNLDNKIKIINKQPTLYLSSHPILLFMKIISYVYLFKYINNFTSILMLLFSILNNYSNNIRLYITERKLLKIRTKCYGIS